MIALIVGPDAATARRELDRLCRAVDPDGSNTARFDGKSSSIESIAVAVGTPPFFGGGRVIVVDDLMTKVAKPAKIQEPNDENEDAPAGAGGLDRLFASVAAGNSLFLIDTGLAAVPAAIKRVAPADATIVTGDPPRGQELVAWIQRAAAAEGSSIDARAARLLAERTFPQTWASKPANPAFDRPPDTDRLGNEIQKLVAAAHPGPITADTVRMMVAAAGEDRLFPLVEGIVSGRTAEALDALEQMHAAGDEPARALIQLYQQAEMAAALASAGGRDPVAVGKDLGLTNPKRMIGVEKSRRAARLAPPDFLDRALETERFSKTGVLRHGDDALYHLLAATAANSDRGGR